MVETVYNYLMEKAKRAEKVVKDLSFLLQLPKTSIGNHIRKYLELEGNGENLGDIVHPNTVYITLVWFDYEGRFMSQLKNVSIKNLDQQNDKSVPIGVYKVLKTMKLGQKSWFNLKLEEDHQKSTKGRGCHVCVTVDQIKYKNAETFVSKCLVTEQNKKEGKILFKEKKFDEAIKKYKNIVNITQGFDRKKYTQQELEDISKMNQNSKHNFLRCFIKLENFEEFDEFAEQYSKELVEKESNQLNIFLRAKTLFKRKYLSDSLEVAKELQQKYRSKESEELVLEIKSKLQKLNK